MQVSTFLGQVDIVLVSHKDTMTAVAWDGGRGIQLVTIAQHDAMETAANEDGHRVGRTVGHATIEHALVVGIDHARCDVGPELSLILYPPVK